MGCAASVDFVNNYPDLWMEEFEALQISKSDLVKLERVFEKIDDSADGQVDLLELLDYIDIQPCPFAKRTFAIFDEDGSGGINFREFVLSLWNFCSCTDSSLRMFAFDLYDGDASGRIEKREIEEMIKEVYGANYDTSSHASQLLSKMQAIAHSEDNCISMEQFALFSRDNPALLFPAFDMQRKIQKKILGHQFWEKHLGKRIQLTEDGKNYVSVKQILEMKINRTAFEQLVEAPLNFAAKTARDHQLVLQTNSMAEIAINSAGIRGVRKSRTGQAAFDRAVKSTQVVGSFRDSPKKNIAWADQP